ncbi:MAG: anhydro-N-acetylmuramic acid kinase [Pseudorhodoplanes sp.]
MLAIGLMSGTSMDGVDAAVLETDGETVSAFGPVFYRPYAEDERAVLRAALAEAAALTDRTARPGAVGLAEALVTRAHAEAVEQLLAAHAIPPPTVDVVGFHGQTVLHRPAHRLTVQIGDGEALARRLRMPVVYDLRAADVAAGGQGAPLVPVFHRALVQKAALASPVAVLNLGGVANVTVIGAGHPLACDTGPANALLDDFMRARTGAARDEDGQHAARGRVNEDAVRAVLAHPFFAAPPPKSLDRNAFHAWMDAHARLDAMSIEDGAATLTAISAAAVVAILAHLPERPKSWIVSGGGARNPTLIRMLAARLAPAGVETADALGWNADALEAQAFAYLAVRSLRGLPLTFPTTTGVKTPLTGGVVVRPA